MLPEVPVTLAQAHQPLQLSRTVLVVDDHLTFAELLAGALETCGMTPLGTACSAAQAVAMARELQPDIVVMDIEMPQQDGLAATRRVREVAPLTVVAVVTAHRDPDWVVRAAQAGASAFVPKDGSLSEMIDVLSRVRPGQMLVAPSTFASGAPAVPAPRGPLRPQLTRREQVATAFFGVRGVGSLYYLSYAAGAATFPQLAEIWAAAGFTIGLSVLVHGITATPVMTRLERQRDVDGPVGATA